jgi:hypothetical protein
MKIAIFTRTGFHHTSFINRLQERSEIACVVREAYPDAQLEGQLNSDGRQTRDYLFLREFHVKYSAGFRHHSRLKDFLKAPSEFLIEKPGTKYLSVRNGEINTGGFGSFHRR